MTMDNFAQQPDDKPAVAELREAVDRAAGLLWTFTFSYLAVWTYMLVTVASVTDRQFLIGTQIQLPLLGTSVQLAPFFILAPLILVILHINLLIYMHFVFRRIELFEESLAGNREQDIKKACNLLTPYLIVEWRLRAISRRNEGIRGVIKQIMFSFACWMLYFVFPLGLLFYIQLKFLRYQHEIITPLHILFILADLVCVWLFWPDLRHKNNNWRWVSPLVFFFVALSCMAFSVGLWFDFRPKLLTRFESYAPELIADFFDYRWSRITVRDATLMRSGPAPEIIAQFRHEAIANGEDPEQGEARAYLDDELAEPLDLHGRNLRHADLQYSRLFHANLEGADLSGANLDSVVLREARLFGSDLKRARLHSADLRGITVCRAENRVDWKCTAHLEGAVLRNAQLQGADLTEAQLQGADIGAAQLQGAILTAANLARANLQAAQLQASDLRDATLDEADFSYAQLDWAILCGPKMQGTILTGTSSYFTTVDRNIDALQNELSKLPDQEIEEHKKILKRDIETNIRNSERREWALERVDRKDSSFSAPDAIGAKVCMSSTSSDETP